MNYDATHDATMYPLFKRSLTGIAYGGEFTLSPLRRSQLKQWLSQLMMFTSFVAIVAVCLVVILPDSTAGESIILLGLALVVFVTCVLGIRNAYRGIIIAFRRGALDMYDNAMVNSTARLAQLSLGATAREGIIPADVSQRALAEIDDRVDSITASDYVLVDKKWKQIYHLCVAAGNFEDLRRQLAQTDSRVLDDCILHPGPQSAVQLNAALRNTFNQDVPRYFYTRDSEQVAEDSAAVGKLLNLL